MTRRSFLDLIPKDVKALYVHVSHRFRGSNPFLKNIQEHYGIDNVLITYAPSVHVSSTPGRTIRLANGCIKSKSEEILGKSITEFSAKKSIETIIYLCSSVCDGYQSPTFPQDVETGYHFWHTVRLAEQHKKPLIVGFQDNFCFSVECPEAEYIQNQDKTTNPISVTSCLLR